MKLFYQVAMPNVEVSSAITSFQAPLEKRFAVWYEMMMTLFVLRYFNCQNRKLRPGKTFVFFKK